MTEKKRKPGRPTENVLKIEGDWKEAVKHALSRGKPPAPAKKAKKKATKAKKQA